MSPDDPRHGTDAGYQRHRRDREAACDPCREAAAAYMRTWHAGRGSDDARRRAHHARLARGRALTRLAHRYPRVYARLLTEEVAKAGGAA